MTVKSKDDLKRLFEKLYGRALTAQEVFTIKHNLTGFFNVLIKIEQMQKKGGKS